MTCIIYSYCTLIHCVVSAVCCGGGTHRVSAWSAQGCSQGVENGPAWACWGLMCAHQILYTGPQMPTIYTYGFIMVCGYVSDISRVCRDAVHSSQDYSRGFENGPVRSCSVAGHTAGCNVAYSHTKFSLHIASDQLYMSTTTLVFMRILYQMYASRRGWLGASLVTRSREWSRAVFAGSRGIRRIAMW